MKAVLNSHRFLGFALLGTALLFLSGNAHTAQAENNFLGNIPAGVGTYQAIAQIGVDTPTTLNSSGNFVFDGVADFFFDVTGNVQIWRSGPLDNFNDLRTGAAVGAAADGLNTLQLEMVSISNVNVVASGGAVISSVQLGDGIADGTGLTTPGSLFSTGGAAEIGPNGETANAFLNLFMNVTIDDPNIPIPVAAQIGLGLDAEYEIGTIYNNAVLNLQAVINEFAPNGISFLQGPTPLGFFAPATHPLVIDLNASPLNRPLTEMQFAQFVSTDIQILQAVPEPGSIVIGLMGMAAFGTFAWRKRAQRNAI